MVGHRELIGENERLRAELRERDRAAETLKLRIQELERMKDGLKDLIRMREEELKRTQKKVIGWKRIALRRQDEDAYGTK